MKIYHLNDPNFKIPAKIDHIHHPMTKKYWGHITTNKADRTNSNYAWLFDPNGEKANSITKATYEILAASSEHVYIKTISDK